MAHKQRPADEGLQSLLESRGTCAICLEIVDDHRVLPCQHIFCLKCLEPIVHDYHLVCPTCRGEHQLKDGAAALPKSFLLMDMLERFCMRCMERGREAQCGCCDRWLCTDCIGACQAPMKERVEKLLARTSKLIADGTEKVKAIEKQQAGFQQRISMIGKQIDKHADELVGLVRGQQKKLRRQLEQDTNKEAQKAMRIFEQTVAEKDKLHLLHIKGTRTNYKGTEQQDKAKELDLWKDLLDRTTISAPLSSNVIEFVPENRVNFESNCSIGTLKKQAITKSLTPGPLLVPAPVSQNPIDYHSGTLSCHVVGSRGSQPGQLRFPSDVAVSNAKESIVVADSENNRIQIFEPTGKFRSMFGCKGDTAGQFDLWSSSGVAVTSQGFIAVSDTWNHRVQLLADSGKPLKTIGSKGTEVGQFDCPCGIASHEKLLYVCDRHNVRVQVMEETGRVVRVISTTGLKPFNVAVSRAGEVFVTGHVRGKESHELRVYTSDGNPVTKAIRTTLVRPRGIAVGRDGHMIVVDASTREVHVMDTEGSLVRTFGSRGDRTGQLEWPAGVACMDNGNVVVADQDNHRLQIYSFD